MKVKDILSVDCEISSVNKAVLYYEDIKKYGCVYYDYIAEIKEDIEDYTVESIYPSCNDDGTLELTIIPPIVENVKAKIVYYEGNYVNNRNNNFNIDDLSELIFENFDVDYICYGVCEPKEHIHDADFSYTGFMKEFPVFEAEVIKNKKGKIILAFRYNRFFNSVQNDIMRYAKMLKKYMLSNKWVFDKKKGLVYKIIVV